MRKVKYSLLILSFIFAGISCGKDEQHISDVSGNTEETLEQGFAFGTRSGTDPEHGDAYTIMSYAVGGQNSTNADRMQIRSDYQYGYYAYDEDGDIQAGALIPVSVNTLAPYAPAEGITPLKIDRTKAQRLSAVPTSGSNTNNTGIYRTAIIHPAIPVRHSTDLGYLAVFDLEDEIWASSPDDRNGDGVDNDPFEITVHYNQQEHEVPSDTKLYPLKAEIRVYFYSQFFDEMGDPTHATPLSKDYTIENIRLVNAGVNGWYNARMGMVYPNYNYTNKNTYSVNLSYDDSNPNYVDFSDEVDDNPSSLIPIPGKDNARAMYLVDDINVFSADYRGAEAGGSPYVIPMTLSVELKMEPTGAINRASIPVSLVIERNKRYTFYVNVTSEKIEVNYSVTPWTDNSYNEGIGGDVMEYKTVSLDKSSDDWDNGGGGSEIIGN